MECFMARRNHKRIPVFAVADAAGRLSWYKIDEGVITKLTSPTDSSVGLYLAFSNSGIYLGGSKLYKRYLLTLDYLSTLGPYRYECAWSQDDYYFGVLSQFALNIFTHSGDTLTTLTSFSVPGQAECFDVSPDGTLYTVGHYNSPYLTTYLRSGETFTPLTVNKPGSGWTSGGCKYSKNGEFLAVSNYMSTWNLLVYGVSGSTFTQILYESTGASNYGIAWSNDSVYLAVTSNFTVITIYKRSGNTFTKLAYPSVNLTGGGVCCAFSDDDNYLVVGHRNSPYFTVYSRSGDVFTKMANPSTLPVGYIHSITFAYSL